MGITVKDLYQESKPKERPSITATYTYPSGAQKLRYSDKHFSWRHPNGKDGWEWNRKGVPRELYVAGNLSDSVFLAEGEKDCDNLHKLGYNAASGEDGAGPGKWRKEYTEQLKGLYVFIFQDNDTVGKDYAQETASALHGVAAHVRVGSSFKTRRNGNRTAGRKKSRYSPPTTATPETPGYFPLYTPTISFIPML